MFPVRGSNAPPRRAVPPGVPGTLGRLRSTPATEHRPAPQEAPITAAIKPSSWGYAEAYCPEDDILGRARQRAQEVGVVPIGTGGAATLRLLAAALQARAVVEVGTGTGVSGLWLLRGMRPDGVLTSVDLEGEHQRLAREAFAEAGVAHNRARLITGAALEVLPRLTDGVYDLVFCDGDKKEYADYLEQALRLLRPGGVLAVLHAMSDDRVPDPARRDEVTTALRGVARRLRDDDRVVPALVPSGDGVLLAARR